MAKTMDEYITDAKKQLQGTYENLKNQTTTNYNNQQSTYNNQKTETSGNYDKQIQTNQRNGVLNQNQYNNNTLSRGMGRSSIATTGLAGIQNTANRVEGELNVAKQNELSKIETLKSQLTDSFNSQMLGYDKEMESKAQEVANQLKQYDDDLAQRMWEREQAVKKAQEEQARWEAEQKRLAEEAAFKQKQAEEDKRRWELEYKLKQQAASSSYSGGGGGGGYYRSSGGRSYYGSGGGSSSSGKLESASSSNARILDNANTAPNWTQYVASSPAFKNSYVNQYGYKTYTTLMDGLKKTATKKMAEYDQLKKGQKQSGNMRY